MIREISTILALGIILSNCGAGKDNEQRWQNAGWKIGNISGSLTLKGHVKYQRHRYESVHASFANKDRVITRTTDGDAKIWNAKTGESIALITGPYDGLSKEILSTSVSPDGKTVLFSPQNKSPLMWNLENGAPDDRPQNPNVGYWQATFSPDGQKIVALRGGALSSVWNTETGELIFNVKTDKKRINRIEFSTDSSRIITHSGRRHNLNVRIWDANTGLKIPIDLDANRIVFSADYSKVYSQTTIKEKIQTTTGIRTKEYQGVFIHNAITGELLRSQRFRRGSIYGRAMFSPDGGLFALTIRTTSGKHIELWSLETEKPTSPLEIEVPHDSGGYIRSAFSPDGKKIVAPLGTSLAVWDVGTGKLIKTFKHRMKPATSFAFSSGGTRLLVQSTWDIGGIFSAHYTLWDMSKNRFIREYKCTKRNCKAYFSPDGKRLVIIRGKKTAVIWDSQTGKLISTLKGHTRRINTVDFSPDGQRIITGSIDGAAIIWDIDH